MKEKVQRADFDGPWKEIFNQYFQQFVALCWPTVYADIVWEKGYEMLENEFQKIARKAKQGKQTADKLIKVWHKDLGETWVMLHIEIQAQRDQDFPERMFTYRYRIHDRYHKPVASLAVLIDHHPHWRPHRYRTELWGSVLLLEFPIIKILDYQAQKGMLAANDHPFALILLAQLEALETRKDKNARLIGKLALARRLFQRGWKTQEIRDIYRFLDWLLALPPSLELEYNTEIKKIEGEHKMSYITTSERIGIQQGIQQGESKFLQSLINHKFGVIPKDYLSHLEKANEQTLLLLGKRCLVAKTIQDVFKTTPRKTGKVATEA